MSTAANAGAVANEQRLKSLVGDFILCLLKLENDADPGVQELNQWPFRGDGPHVAGLLRGLQNEATTYLEGSAELPALKNSLAIDIAIFQAATKQGGQHTLEVSSFQPLMASMMDFLALDDNGDLQERTAELDRANLASCINATLLSIEQKSDFLESSTGTPEFGWVGQAWTVIKNTVAWAVGGVTGPMMDAVMGAFRSGGADTTITNNRGGVVNIFNFPNVTNAAGVAAALQAAAAAAPAAPAAPAGGAVGAAMQDD